MCFPCGAGFKLGTLVCGALALPLALVTGALGVSFAGALGITGGAALPFPLVRFTGALDGGAAGVAVLVLVFAGASFRDGVAGRAALPLPRVLVGASDGCGTAEGTAAALPLLCV
jgi:hypothetical protein